MTVINPSSISGITSITMPSGDGNVLTIHTNDGTERFRIDSSGNVKVGSACTISQDGDVFFTGVCTATTLSGAASGLTGALPAIDGSALTGMASTENVRTGILDVAGVSTFRNTMNVGAAVTISESGIEASGIGITVANINGTQIGGRRNLIINGAMEVAQHGTSSTSDGVHTVDRLNKDEGGTDESVTQSQVDVASGTTPYTEGFRKAFRLTNGNQTGGTGVQDYTRITYKIEAQDLAKSGWNYTSSSSFVTLQFWIKSSVAQNFYFIFNTADGGQTRSYVMETGSLSADTWTKITKTFPGDSQLAFDNDTGIGCYLYIYGYLGTSYADNSVSVNAWKNVANPQTPLNTTTWWTTNDATLEITGLQLEVGPQATAFEHRSFGEELSLCQRYCQVFEGPSNSQGGDSQTALCENCSLYQANNLFMSIPTKVSMRAKPSMSVATGTQYYVAYSNGGGVDLDGTNLNMNGNTGTEFFVINHTVTSLGTSGHSALFRMSNSSAKVTFSAEL
mgnify:CR=1 FL=1